MSHLTTLLIGGLVAAAIGLLSDDGWPGYVIGAVLALSLWVMLFAGQWGASAATRRPWSWPSPTTYAATAAVAVVIGYVLYLTVGDGENGAWWAVGMILAGVAGPFAVTTQRSPSER